MNDLNLSGLRGYVRPRRIGLGPRPFDEATDMGRQPVSSFEAPPGAASPPLMGGLGLGPEPFNAQPTGEVPGLDTPAPRPQRAMGELEQAFTAQTPEEQRYQHLRQSGPADPKAGIWERIKGALLSGGLAAQQAGNQNPEAQGAALLGGLLGGGISRRFAGNMQHNLRDIPQARGLAAESRETADAGLGRRMGFARSFGYDPESGTNTADTERYENERAFRGQQAQEKQTGDYIEKLLQMHVPIPRGLAQRSGQPELAGVTSPFAPKTPHWAQDRQGNWVDLNAAGPVQGKDPNAITDYQKERLRLEGLRIQQGGQLNANQQAQLDRAERQEAATREKEARDLAAKYNTARAKHSQSATEFGQMATELGNPTGRDSKGDPAPIWKGKILTASDVAAKQTEADALESDLGGMKQVAGEHPNLEVDASGAIRFKAGNRVAAGGGKAATTVTQERYNEQVRKHGQEATDKFMAKNGITVQ